MCCFERKEDNCCCMRIYHLMDKGEQCLDKAILCRLEKMKDCECGRHDDCDDKKDCGKKDDCYCEKKYEVRNNNDCGCRKQPEWKPDCKPDWKPDCKPDFKPDFRPDCKPDCKPNYRPDCKPDYKPDCDDRHEKPDCGHEKRENPELRCECGCNWKPDYDWCYPYTVIRQRSCGTSEKIRDRKEKKMAALLRKATKQSIIY